MKLIERLFHKDEVQAAKEISDELRAEELKEEYERRKKERLPFELQWAINANFLQGNQYCDINTYRENGIEQLLPDYKWRERETFNRIAPIMETRMGLLQKINYRMAVKPRRGDIDDYAKADIATRVLEYQQDISDFNAWKNRALSWAEVTGSSYFVVGWNTNLGEVASRRINMFGEEEIYREGDVEYSVLSPYEVYPENVMSQGIESQNSMMVVQVMGVKEAYEIYGVSLRGASIPRYVITPKTVGYGLDKECAVGTLATQTIDDAVRIITYYEKPSRERLRGRMSIMADEGSGAGKMIYDGELPYDEIPIVQVVSKEVPGQFFGKSIIETLIPIQRAYNGVINSAHEWIKRLALGGLYVEDGSVDMDALEDDGLPPGAIIPYKKGYNPPRAIENGDFPDELIEEREMLQAEMEYVAGVSQLQMTGQSSSVTSGTAIESLREIDNTRMAMVGENIRTAVMKLARMWLKLYKRYATFPRVVRIAGTDSIGEAITWCSEDIQSFEIKFTTENELTLSEETQKQNFLQAVQLGAFTDETGQVPQRVKNKILECMKIGSYTDILDMNGLQLKAAQRENTLMRHGAWCDINEYDDDTIHAEEHLRFILSTEYKVVEKANPEYAKLILAHWKAHKARAETPTSGSSANLLREGG